MSTTQLTTTSNTTLKVLGMPINNIDQALQIADYFAKSDLVPKDYRGKPGNIIVAWQKGFEVGLMPQQALETIAVINGRACIWGDGLIALVKNSPLEEWTQEWIEGEGDLMVAYCETKPKGISATVKRSFSVAQAKKANLWGKNVWASYPERMLQMRARGFCLRDAYPHLLNGLQLAEEIVDIGEATPLANKREIEMALSGVGLTLAVMGDKGYPQGNTYNHSKLLKELGFLLKEGRWEIALEPEMVKAPPLVVVKKATEPEMVETVVEVKKEAPKRELMRLLEDNGLSKQEMAEFVKTAYGQLTDESAAELLAPENRDLLLSQVKEYLQSGAEEENPF